MNDKQLEQFEKWFYDYVATFYIGQTLHDDNIRLKECHTRRVCGDILMLADKLGLNEHQKLIAQTTGLFHDVGRFEQYKRFNSYNDVGTTNHALLGLEIMAENKILDCLNPHEKNLIESAVRLHGEKDLPKNLDKETEFFAKLIRDFDKLDIYFVIVERLDDMKKNPEKYMTTLGYPMRNDCSPEIVRAVLENRTIDYKDFKSINDMFIGIIGWLSDINFVPVLAEIKNRGHIKKIVKFLPDTDDIRNIEKHAENLIEKKIKLG
ncbi:MAG: HD domain-containing protein [Phycisphaerae bacterium]|jgi:hypothetical protein